LIRFVAWNVMTATLVRAVIDLSSCSSRALRDRTDIIQAHRKKQERKPHVEIAQAVPGRTIHRYCGSKRCLGGILAATAHATRHARARTRNAARLRHRTTRWP